MQSPFLLFTGVRMWGYLGDHYLAYYKCCTLPFKAFIMLVKI